MVSSQALMSGSVVLSLLKHFLQRTRLHFKHWDTEPLMTFLHPEQDRYSPTRISPLSKM